MLICVFICNSHIQAAYAQSSHYTEEQDTEDHYTEEQDNNHYKIVSQYGKINLSDFSKKIHSNNNITIEASHIIAGGDKNTFKFGNNDINLTINETPYKVFTLDGDFIFGEGNNIFNFNILPKTVDGSPIDYNQESNLNGNYIAFGTSQNIINIVGINEGLHIINNISNVSPVFFISGDKGIAAGNTVLNIENISFKNTNNDYGTNFTLLSFKNSANLTNVNFLDNATTIIINGEINNLTLSGKNHLNNNKITLTGNANVTINGLSSDAGYNIDLKDTYHSVVTLNSVMDNFDYSKNEIILSNNSINTINYNTDKNYSFTAPINNLVVSNNSNIVNINGGGTLTDSSGRLINFYGQNNELNINNTNLALNENITFSNGNAILLVKSDKQEVTINGTKTIDASNSSNAKLNINSTFKDDGNPKFTLHNQVTFNATLINFNSLNLGDTTVNINIYKQTNKDLTLYSAVTQNNGQKISGVLNINNADFGNKKVNVVVYGFGAYKIGDVFNVNLINSTNTINGLDINNINFQNTLFIQKQNINLTSNNLNADYKVINNFESIDNPGNPNSSDNAIGNNKNTHAVAKVLDQIEDSGSAAKNNTLDKSLSYITENENSDQGRRNVEQFLTSLEPINNEVLLNIANINDSNFNNTVNSNAVNTSSIPWMVINYANSNIANTNNVDGANLNSIYFSTGYNKEINTNNILGIAFGYTNSDIDGKNDLYTGILQTLKIGLQHTIRLNNSLSLTTMANYGLNNYDLTRDIIANNTNADLALSGSSKSHPKLNNINVNTLANYNIKLSTFDTIIYAGAGYTFNNMADYTEKGFDALKIKGFNASLVNGKIGAGISKTYNISETSVFKPTFNLEVQYTYYNLPDTKASFADDNKSNEFTNYNPSYNMLTVMPTIALSYKFKSFESNIYANTLLSKDITNIVVGVNFIYKI